MHRALASLPLLLSACGAAFVRAGGDRGPRAESADPAAEEEVAGATWPNACDRVFDPDELPTFEVEVTPEDLETLEYLWSVGYTMQQQGEDPKIYFPATLRYGDEVVTDAAIRLRGNPCCSWYGTKMQFDVSFQEYDPDGRFHGMRKLDFDAPYYDYTLLHNRLAFTYFADLGVPSLCVNNARLDINGEFFGLYALLEHMDKEWVERNFEESDGTLYKYGYYKATNEDDPDRTAIERLWGTTNVDRLESICDLDEAVLEWAGEAILPDGDGFWAGGWNFFLYDHPSRGFLWVPWDMDYTWEVVPAEADPLTWTTSWGTPQQHYVAVTTDDEWGPRYVDALREAREVYDVGVLTGRIEDWSAQIAESIEEDPNLPFTPREWRRTINQLETHVENRAAFIDEWLAEYDQGR